MLARGLPEGCVRGWVYALTKGHFFVSGGEVKDAKGPYTWGVRGRMEERPGVY